MRNEMDKRTIEKRNETFFDIQLIFLYERKLNNWDIESI